MASVDQVLLDELSSGMKKSGFGALWGNGACYHTQLAADSAMCLEYQKRYIL